MMKIVSRSLVRPLNNVGTMQPSSWVYASTNMRFPLATWKKIPKTYLQTKCRQREEEGCTPFLPNSSSSMFYQLTQDRCSSTKSSLTFREKGKKCQEKVMNQLPNLKMGRDIYYRLLIKQLCALQASCLVQAPSRSQKSSDLNIFL